MPVKAEEAVNDETLKVRIPLTQVGYRCAGRPTHTAHEEVWAGRLGI